MILDTSHELVHFARYIPYQQNQADMINKDDLIMGGSYIVTKQEGTVGEAFPVHSAAFTVKGQEKFNKEGMTKSAES